MQEVKLNTNATVNPLQQANLQSVLNTLDAQAPLSPLLSKASNLQVSSAPVDLDALVAKLNVETSDKQESVAKTTLASAFTNVIARTLESGNVSEHNMEVLNEAKEYGTQLNNTKESIRALNQEIQSLQREIAQGEKQVNTDQQKVNTLTKKVADLQKQKTQAEKNVEALQADVDSLNSLIDSETDPVQKAKLEKQLTDAETKLAKAQNQLTTIETNLSTANTNLTQAQTTLSTHQTNLAAKKTSLAEKQQALSNANTSKADLEKKINDKMNELTDVDVIRALAEALKMDASDVQNLTQDNKAERSEEQEKYLETHSPLRIIQDAIANHDQDILDTIASKREEKI